MRKLILTTLTLLVLATPAFAEVIKVGANGLVCAFCASGIEKTFKADPAVADIHVDLDAKLITIKTATDKTLTDAVIKERLENAGYTLTSIVRE